MGKHRWEILCLFYFWKPKVVQVTFSALPTRLMKLKKKALKKNVGKRNERW